MNHLFSGEYSALLKRTPKTGMRRSLKTNLAGSVVPHLLDAGHPAIKPLYEGLLNAISQAPLEIRLNEAFCRLSDCPQVEEFVQMLLDLHLQCLTPREVTVLRALSLFDGAVSVERLASRFTDIVRCCHLFEQRGLLVATTSGRLTFDPTVRQMLRDGTPEAERAVAQADHDDAYYRLISESGPHLMGTPDREWLALLEAEADNVLGVLRRAEGNSLALLSHLWRWWIHQRPVQEGINFLHAALSRATPGCDIGLLAQGYRAIGVYWQRSGRPEYACFFLKQALVAAEKAGIESVQLECLLYLGNAYRDREEFATSRRCHQAGLTMAVRLGDIWHEASIHNALGVTDWVCNHCEEAFAHLREAATDFAAIGDHLQAARVLGNQALLAEARRDYVASEAAHAKSLEAALASGDDVMIAIAQHNLGGCCYHLDKLGEAEGFYRDSLETMCKVGYFYSVPLAVFNLGQVAFRLGKVPQSLVLVFAAARLRKHYASVWPPRVVEEYEETVGKLKADTRPSVVTRFSRMGMGMDLEAVLAYLSLGHS